MSAQPQPREGEATAVPPSRCVSPFRRLLRRSDHAGRFDFCLRYLRCLLFKKSDRTEVNEGSEAEEDAGAVRVVWDES